MTAKPTEIFHWADVGGDIVTPSAGRQNVGYVEGEFPPAPERNYLDKTVGQWLAWLNAADVDFGTATVHADDLLIDDDAVITSDLAVGGTVTVNGLSIANVSGSLAIVDLNVTDDFSVAGDCDLSGADTIKYPESAQFIQSAGPGYLYSGTATQTANYWNGGAVGTVHVPINCVPVGWRITHIVVHYKRNSGTLNFDLYSASYASLGASIQNAAVSSGTADADVDMTGINHTVASGRSLILQASMGDAADRLYGLTVYYDKVV